MKRSFPWGTTQDSYCCVARLYSTERAEEYARHRRRAHGMYIRMAPHIGDKAKHAEHQLPRYSGR